MIFVTSQTSEWNSEQKRVRPDIFGIYLSYKHALGDAK